MPTDQTRNVSLTAEPNAFIGARFASGQYQNVGEVVRSALRLLQRQHDCDERVRGVSAASQSEGRHG